MIRGGYAVACGLLLLSSLTACTTTVAGTADLAGRHAGTVLLTERGFPGRGAVRPASPTTRPSPTVPVDRRRCCPNRQGCANALTNVIAESAERGPGSAVSYSVSFDGARIVMTVLSWQLDLEGLAATASRCERFEAFFDPQSHGIPITTTQLPADDGSLVYQQTMKLPGAQNSIYMAFANVGPMAVFGIVFPTENPDHPGQSDTAANLYRHRRPVRSTRIRAG